MRTNYEHNVTVQGNIDGRSIKATFDENSLAHLMSVLIDLYSDPELAVIREYSTNALDANIEAGNTSPIEVTLPSALSPYFKVKDNGVGLSVDDIERVYSKYGASTKRDTDAQTGMLGLGCKSGLTYTNTFTIVARKNGIKTQAMVSRLEDGTGEFRIVDTRSTDEPNGVEIVIPAKNAQSFHEKANKFFRFWKPGTVLVNGKQPDPINGLQVAPGLMATKEVNCSYVVMGNVAYPVDSYTFRLSNLLGHGQYVVAEVPMGSVNFTPSREALQYTNRTKTTLTDIKTRFDAALSKAALEAVRNAPTAHEALALSLEWGRTIRQKYDWKGTPIPDRFEVEGVVFDRNAYRGGATKFRSVYAQTVNAANTLIVTGFDRNELNAGQKKKIKAYCDANNISQSKFYFVSQDFGSPWLENIKRMKWADIAAYKIPRDKRAHTPQNYDIFDQQTNWWKNVLTVLQEDVIYFSPTDVNYSAQLIQKLFPKHTLLKLPKNRWDKFRRENPKARTLKEILEEERKNVLDTLSESDIMVLTTDWSDKETVKRLDESRIDDPEFAAFVTQVKAYKPGPSVERYELFRKVCMQAYVSVGELKGSEMMNRYPFLPYGRDKKEHTYEYLNAVYAARKAGN